MKEIKVKVEGMSCSGCERSIENSLRLKVKEVKDIRADRTKKEVVIYYEESLPDLELIRQAIEETGYKFVG
ncbi:MAG: heavy-metal-associated domain-containing protein [bacterium]